MHEPLMSNWWIRHNPSVSHHVVSALLRYEVLQAALHYEMRVHTQKHKTVGVTRSHPSTTWSFQAGPTGRVRHLNQVADGGEAVAAAEHTSPTLHWSYTIKEASCHHGRKDSWVYEVALKAPLPHLQTNLRGHQATSCDAAHVFSISAFHSVFSCVCWTNSARPRMALCY